ncbi:MAG: protein kinase [Deltaproteobacteria bacterium]|nr:protein kinase [Deltaproteobacteria bacterium]
MTDAEVRQALFGVSSAPMLVGRFVTLQVLGRGSFGTVYLAYDPRLDRRVALKVLTVRGREDNIELLREARALAQLEHPNVVTIFDAFETAQGLPAIAMAYVEGSPPTADCSSVIRLPRCARSSTCSLKPRSAWRLRIAPVSFTATSSPTT